MELNDRTFASAHTPAVEAAALNHAGNLVREFLLHLKASPIQPMTIVPLGSLPAGKESLVNSFRLLIASETRLTQRAQLKKVGLLLAQFQAEADDAQEPVHTTDDPLNSWIGTVTAGVIDDKSLWLAVYQEQERLTDLFEVSSRMAERRGSTGRVAVLDDQPEDGRAH